MQSSKAQHDETAADTASAIVEIMQRMNVAPLPRNYEIFYEAYAGSNEPLRAALDRLGSRPKQSELDGLAHEFFAQSNQAGIVDNAHSTILSKLEEVTVLLQKEHSSLEKYGTILDQTSAGLAGKQHVTADLLQRIAGIMSTATDTTIAQGRQIASSIADTSAELAEVKAKLNEYKKLADTDALTQVSNRRAFDRALDAIYADEKSIMFGALIIADIDRFKDINDLHGHPAGDKVLQQIARLFVAAAPADMMVARTGGEEFAIVVEGLSEEGTVALADEMRAMVEKTPFIHAEGESNITVSVGVCMATDAASAEDLYAKADHALYASKANGRNRVTKYPVSGPALQRKNWMIYRTD